MSATATQQLEISDLPITGLHESPTNPRKHFDKAFMEGLVASIKENGIITPLLVRVGSREIVAGTQRYRAAKELGMTKVPCVLRDMTDEEVLEIQTIENLQRIDVHGLDEAKGFRLLLDQAKYDVPKLASKIGKSESYVYRSLKLCDLAPNAQKMFLAGDMQLGHALCIARLQPEQQKEALQWVKRGDSARGLAEEINRRFHLQLKQAPFKLDDETLVPKAGSCMLCQKRTGFNPSLFPDVKDRDICTDSVCFEEKTRAFIKIQVGTHPDAVLLHAGGHLYQKPDKGLAPHEWTDAGLKVCPNTKEGVVAWTHYYGREDDQLKLGDVLMVCTNLKACKVHSERAMARERGTAAKMTPEEKRRRAKHRADLSATRLGHSAMVKELRAKPDKVEADDLRRLALELIDDYRFRYRAVLMAVAFGLTAEGKTPSAKAYNGRDNMRKLMAKASRGDLTAFLASYSLTPAGDQTIADKEMWNSAKRFGVDIAGIQKLATQPKPKSGSVLIWILLCVAVVFLVALPVRAGSYQSARIVEPPITPSRFVPITGQDVLVNDFAVKNQIRTPVDRAISQELLNNVGIALLNDRLEIDERRGIKICILGKKGHVRHIERSSVIRGSGQAIHRIYKNVIQCPRDKLSWSSALVLDSENYKWIVVGIPSWRWVNHSCHVQPGAFGIDDRLGVQKSGFRGTPSYIQSNSGCENQNPSSEEFWPESPFQIILCLLVAGLFLFYGSRLSYRRDGFWWGILACSLNCAGLGMCLLAMISCNENGNQDSNSNCSHNAYIVPHKYFLTSLTYWGTLISREGTDMANILPMEKQVAVISALAEGSGIRQIERITGVHRDTIMRLGMRVGKGCAALLDRKMHNLSCQYLQFDEIWGFIGKKERHCTVDDSPELGDVWTFCAIDSKTKLVPSFKVGKRDSATANAFVSDVASRVSNRVQISSDALRAYVDAVDIAFGSDVDFAQVIKSYVQSEGQVISERKYSAAEFVIEEKKAIAGFPNLALASTSHVERLNGTTRLHMRRLTRLTYAFSKKRENFEAAVALHFAYYNFVKRHNTLRATPAMAAGIERDFWTVGDLVKATA